MKIDKQNGNVCFSEQEHVYWDAKTSERYISVTTLIHKYVPVYDKEFWLRYKALEELYPKTFSSMKRVLLDTKKISKSFLDTYKIDSALMDAKANEISAQWETKSKESCEHGTKIHLEKELSFYKDGKNKCQYFNLDNSFVCKKDYYNLDLEDGIYPEYLVYADFKGLKIAGQIDLLIKRGNDIYIGDFKTNTPFKMNSYYDPKKRSYETLLYPINTLQNCHYGIYTMQLSLYAYMLKQINPEFNIKALQLIHIDRERKETLIPVTYMEKEVQAMIKHYKKYLKAEERKLKNKPIIY